MQRKLEVLADGWKVYDGGSSLAFNDPLKCLNTSRLGRATKAVPSLPPWKVTNGYGERALEPKWACTPAVSVFVHYKGGGQIPCMVLINRTN